VGAVLTRARSDLRGGLRRLLTLSVLVGLIGGAALVAASGGRRTDSAYRRFLESSKAAQVVVSRGGPFFPGYRDVNLSKVAELPQVEAAWRFKVFAFAQARTADGRVLPFGDVGGIAGPVPEGGAMYRPRVISGRLPDPTRPDEIALGYPYARGKDLVPGTRLQMSFVDTTFQPGPPIGMRVVGVVLLPGSLLVHPYFWQIFYTPAFYRLYEAKYGLAPSLFVRLKGGEKQVPAFHRAVDRLAGGPGPLILAPGEESRATIERVTHLQALTLWMFAALAVLAGLLVFGQTLARHTFIESIENPILRTLGMTRGQLVAVVMVRTVVVALAGAAVAVALAVLLSPIMPVGIAHLAEPKPGVSVDSLIVGAGAAMLALLVLGLGVVPAIATANTRSGVLGTAEVAGANRPSPLAGLVSRAGLRPTFVTGIRMAFEPGRGRTAVPVKSALAAVIIVMMALGTNMTFLTSFAHWRATPRLYGWNWDAMVGGPFAIPDVTPRQVTEMLARDDSVDRLSAGAVLLSIRLQRGSRLAEVNVWGVDPVRGSVYPPVVEGRWPTTAAEVAMGSETLRKLGARVGDQIELRTSEAAARMTVVGRAVFPELASGGTRGLAIGAGLTTKGTQRLIPTMEVNTWFLRFRRQLNPAAEIRRLYRTRPIDGAVAGPLNGTDISTYAGMQRVPLALAALLSLAAVATLAHLLVSSVRRRRRDLAILKTLGFLRGQIRWTVVVQASAFTLVGLLVGVPLGVAAGRWWWTLFADRMGIVPEPTLPLVLIGLLVPATVLLANLIAAVPARVAGRTQPALVLRAE
jgi:putative ABC transport system permease protein